MGARQTKRSVDISGTPKKGDQENGAVAVPEEKLEKIIEGDAVVTKVNVNGSTTTTSTLTAEQQEAAAAATETESSPLKNENDQPVEKTEQAAVATNGETEEPTTPSSPTEPAEEGGSKKKKKLKKPWSFRSFSFSKKDKVKPGAKEGKQDTLPEDSEPAAQQEQVTVEATNASSVQNEEPPPLPSSPPPTPAEETSVEKDETPTISEGDVDASGGGEGLAEPIEDAELEVTTPVPIAEKLSEAIEQVEAKISSAVVDKVTVSIEDAVAAVAELTVSTPVSKHIEQDEDGELKVTSPIAPIVKQPLTNGVVEMNGSAEINGNSELNGNAE